MSKIISPFFEDTFLTSTCVFTPRSLPTAVKSLSRFSITPPTVRADINSPGWGEILNFISDCSATPETRSARIFSPHLGHFSESEIIIYLKRAQGHGELDGRAILS